MSIWCSSHSYCINEQKLHHKSGKREEKLSQWDELWCNYYVKRNKSNSICDRSHSRLNTILACLWARTSTLLYPWGVGGAEYTVGAAWMMEDVSWMGGMGPCLDAEADTIETISDTYIKTHRGQRHHWHPTRNCGKTTQLIKRLPEAQQKCAEWAEALPETFGRALWVGDQRGAVEEVWVEEAPLEGHESYATSDHLATHC